MRLGVRTFLCLFVPLLALLSAGFWAVEKAIMASVESRLSSVLHDHTALTDVQSTRERERRRSLRIVAENPALKAGVQKLLVAPKDETARLNVEKQLREISSVTAIDLLFLSRVNGGLITGVVRSGAQLVPMAWSVPPPTAGLMLHEGVRYQITSVPVNEAGGSLAILSVGNPLVLNTSGTPLLLAHSGKVIESSLPGISTAEIDNVLRTCATNEACEVDVPSGPRISLAAGVDLGGGYSLRQLINMDVAVRDVHAKIRRVFVTAAILALLGIVALTWASSRVISRPIDRVVRHLRDSEAAGLLCEFDASGAAAEVRELMVGINRAAAAIRVGQDNLHDAYLQFVESLASALDARDPYTAGHSGRVCRLSCAIARSLNFDRESLRTIGIGALLHDIGKIGVPDSVLQKPGRLTEEEFDLIRQHPSIGRHILASVNGFAPYLEVVELHHENWDGTGYPHGLRAEQAPLSARIVHVADAFDAMTSDRPYRPGMTQEVAVRILEEAAGRSFDPVVVDAFVRLWRNGDLGPMDSELSGGFEQSLRYLAGALDTTSPRVRAAAGAGA